MSINRRVYQSEQPHVLHRELQKTLVVGEAPEAVTKPAAVARTGFAGVLLLLWSYLFPQKKAAPACEVLPVSEGLPHGVVDAVVYFENFKVVNEQNVDPSFYFCHTKNYVADRRTTGGADNGQYPPIEKSRISIECAIPQSGFYPVKALISLNGEATVRVVEFNAVVPEELKQLIPAGA